MDAMAIMFFGYFAPYKGLEELLPAVKLWVEDNPSNYFVFAGSTPQRYAGRRSEVLDSDLNAMNQIIRTGFVPDDDVPLVFGMVDAVILPYTINMAASGPMNIALGYGVPMLLSSVFSRDYGASYDFEPTTAGILEALRSFSNDGGRRLLLKEETLRIRSSRTWQGAAARTIDLYRDDRHGE
jgi:glycosyltransferase involved in cell wall biosynthesis